MTCRNPSRVLVVRAGITLFLLPLLHLLERCAMMLSAFAHHYFATVGATGFHARNAPLVWDPCATGEADAESA